ncbi:MAG: hypothetical protein GY868_03405 [Deltaproteobacteria bacterium]|nr:hypothetical protein [Deltaproteobacteria bacterium]
MKESSSDFSIVQKYIELKTKYEKEIREHGDKSKSLEDKFKKHIVTLENEIKKRNDMIKSLEAAATEVNGKIAEKDEQLKTLGLQMHRMKMDMENREQDQAEQENKKGKFGLFK